MNAVYRCLSLSLMSKIILSTMLYEIPSFEQLPTSLIVITYASMNCGFMPLFFCIIPFPSNIMYGGVKKRPISKYSEWSRLGVDEEW